MKKVTIISLLISIMVSLFGVCGYAADFKETSRYYDFNNYDSGFGSGSGPDDNWDYAYMQDANKNYIKSEKRNWFGGVYDGDKNSNVMQIKAEGGKSGEPVLKFGNILKEGQFHISFDLKIQSLGGEFYIGLYDGTNMSNEKDKVLETNYSIGPWFKPNKNIIYSYQNNGSGKTNGKDMQWSTQHWQTAESDIPYTLNEWHHIDMYFGDYAKMETAVAKYYFDGHLINQNDVYFKNCNGFKALYFRTGNSADILIDNVYVKNFNDSENLCGFLDSEVIDEASKTFRLNLSEWASKKITKDDIVITSASGDSITDFEVTSNSNTYADVKINGAITPGRYNVILKDSVTGAFYSNPMKDSVTFRTAPRYVDGVMCPDVEKVSYISHDGKEQNKKSEISTGTAAINIQFTTGIDDSNPSENIMLTHNGIETACTFTVSSDKKTISLTPESGFEPETEYTLSVSGNIAASESANAKMGLDYTEKFKTLNDAMYVISTEDIEKDGENAYFKVKVIKTNDEPEHKYTYAVAGYKSVVNPENGKTYMQMTALNRFPVIISETDKGIISFGNNQPLDISNAEKINGFFWEYPNNLPIVTKEFENK